MSNRVYDILKWLCTVIVPAICTLIITLNSLWQWNLPIEAIIGTITALDAFAGTVLGISSAQYHAQEVSDNDRI